MERRKKKEEKRALRIEKEENTEKKD